MDPNHKKIALRMIPYGLYVLAAETRDGRVSAATVNWVMQASFEPPLVAVGVKADSSAHQVIKESGGFALSVLGKGQQDIIKRVQREVRDRYTERAAELQRSVSEALAVAQRTAEADASQRSRRSADLSAELKRVAGLRARGLALVEAAGE